MTIIALMLSAAFAHASDKDFPPGCLTGADNSRTALVALDNYTATRGSNEQIEQLKSALQSGQSVFIDGNLLKSMNISEDDARAILLQINAADNAN